MAEDASAWGRHDTSRALHKSQNPQHYERDLQPRDSLWVDEVQPDHCREAKCKRQIEPEALEPEELQRLIGALGTRERVLIMLDLPTGMRVSELLALQWDDIVSKGSRSPFARPSGTSILVPSRRKGASGRCRSMTS